MKDSGTNKRQLESLKIFPYVAWMLVVIFSLFVYKLVTQLNSSAKTLDQQSSSLESKVNTSSKDLRNLDFGQ